MPRLAEERIRSYVRTFIHADPRRWIKVGGERQAPAVLNRQIVTVAIAEKAWWPPGPVWRGMKKRFFFFIWVKTADRPACTEKLYWLRYLSPAHKIYLYEGWNFNSSNYLFTADTK